MERSARRPRKTETMSDQLTIWQINLQHSKVASASLVVDLESANKPCLVLLQEPHIYKGAVKNLSTKNYDLFNAGTKSRSAILSPRVLGGTVVRDLSDNDYVCVIYDTKINQNPKILVISGYLDITVNPQIMLEKLQKIMEFSTENKLPVVMGLDANAWSTLWGSKETNNRGAVLEEFLLQNDLFICNVGSVPTFVASRTSGTIPDVTVCSIECENLISDWLVNEEDSHSDHRRIEFNLKFQYTFSTRVQNLEKTNWTLFNKIIDRVKFPEHPNWTSEQLDKEVDYWNGKIKYALDKACPPRVVKPYKKRQPKWWNSDIAELRHKVRSKFRVARDRGLESDWETYRNLRTDLKKLIKHSKKQSWMDFASQNSSTKDIARLIKNLGKSRLPPAGLFRDQNGVVCTNVDESVQAVFDALFPGNTPNPNEQRTRYCTLTQIHKWANFVTEEKVAKAINTFRANKSPGPDGIKPIVLQHLSAVGIKYLTKIFQVSITLRYVPRAWREATVALLPKPNKERYDNPNSYRPISLTSFTFKALERVVLWEMEDSALIKNPLSKHQHAYLKGKSCETALTSLIDKLERGVLRGQFGLGIFLDIAGAFNNVNPIKAVEAMNKRGISPSIVQWYSFYLQNRTATITINDTQRTRGLPRGLPQGGIISPIAWDLVVDSLLEDLNQETNVLVVGYADDLAIALSSFDPASLVEIAQDYINKACAWGRENDLQFNAKKTEAVFFTRRTKVPEYKKLHVNGVNVDYADGCKYLGVYLDKKLRWSTHIQQKIAKCKKLLYTLKLAVGRSWGLQPQLVRWIYIGMVRPIFAYACHIWWNFHPTKDIIKQLTRLNRLACLAIAKVHKSTPTKGMEMIYNIPPLELFLESKAIEAYYRVRNFASTEWLNPGGQPGHIKRLGMRANAIKFPNNIVEERIFVREWSKHFRVILDFEKTRHDSNENLKSTYVYTDGSNYDSKTGWGFVIKKGHRIRSQECGYLGLNASVYQAEIEAVKQAAKFLVDSHYREATIIFRIDNQAAVRALANPVITLQQVLECYQALQKLANRNRVSIRWIKGHAGHAGNDSADVVAKAGTQLPVQGPEPFVWLPRASRKLAIREHLNLRWEKQWKESEEFVHTKNFYEKPSNRISKHLVKLTREQMSLLVQIVTGHCNMLYHSRHYKESPDEEDTLCRLCQEDDEKPWHVLTDCPALMQRRLTFFNTPLYLTKPISWSFIQVLTFFQEHTIRQLFDQLL